MSKISVIIPVYNVEADLPQCLESVLNQTLKDIEIICVDDGSQDGSAAILERFAQQDSRIKVVKHEKNSGLVVTRRDGVICAAGEYIMFLDSDDFLEPTACEKLYHKIRQENVEVLHFTSRVVYNGHGTPPNLDAVENIIKPYSRGLSGMQVFQEGFVKRKFWGTLWNKIYQAELVKKAFSYVGDDYINMGDDVYIFCLISCFARSYLGWESEPLHNYRYGQGISVATQVNLRRFEQQCILADVLRHMTDFCKTQGVYEVAEAFLRELHSEWSGGCCHMWVNRLPKDCAVEGWDIMCKYWGAKEAVSIFARHYFENSDRIAAKLSRLPGISLKEKNIQTVALYHWKLNEGGIERVISILAPMLLKMGYKVVIVTDEPVSEKDFPVPVEVLREKITHYQEIDGRRMDCRLADWEKLLEKHHIDVVLYSNWMSEILLWDVLYLKRMGIPVVVHTHGVYAYVMNTFPQLFCKQVREIPLADGIVTLSREDTEFWKLLAGNVHHIPNPAAAALHEVNSGKWENKSIIWVGRASHEKQPDAIFDIMKLVADQETEAKLYVLGDFYDSRWKKHIEQKGLTDKVILCGMVSNVYDYLEKASVFTCTSRYEGFPMSLVEAQAHGLPTVMFRLAHLTMAEPGRGVISVDMDDCASAAQEIVTLLRNREKWESASLQAKESFRWLKDYDLEAAWQGVLTSGQPEHMKDPVLERITNQIVDSFYVQCNKTVSLSAFAWLRRKIMRIIQCLREDGLSYTIRLSIQRLKNE